MTALSKKDRPAHVTWVVAILMLGLAVRLAGLFDRPIWYDEAFSLLFAEKGPAAMLAGTLGTTTQAAEEHPLLYYTLLWGWIHTAGASIAAARLFSIVIGMITIGLGLWLAKMLFEKKIYGSGIVLALSPFLVHHAQEIRMYGLLAAFTTAATLALWQALHTRQWRWWLIFSLCSTSAMYTHTLAAIYLVPLALIPFLQRRWNEAFRVALAGLGALLLYIPWLFKLPAQIGKIQAGYWIEQPGWERLITTLLHFVVNLPLPGITLMWGLLVTITAVALGIMQTITARKSLRDQSRQAGWLLYLAFVPPVLLFVISLWRPVFIERALLPSGVMFAIWLGWALFTTPMPKVVRSIIAGLTLTGMLMGIGIHLRYSGFPYAPYAQIADYIQHHREPQDLVIHSNKLTALPLFYYEPELPQIFIADPAGSATDTLAAETRQVLGLSSAQTPEAAANGYQRVWLVIFDKSIKEYQQSGYATHPHIEWFETHYHKSTTYQFDEIIVFLYDSP